MNCAFSFTEKILVLLLTLKLSQVKWQTLIMVWRFVRGQKFKTLNFN
jgi:hypothetical protein